MYRRVQSRKNLVGCPMERIQMLRHQQEIAESKKKLHKGGSLLYLYCRCEKEKMLCKKTRNNMKRKSASIFRHSAKSEKCEIFRSGELCSLVTLFFYSPYSIILLFTQRPYSAYYYYNKDHNKNSILPSILGICVQRSTNPCSPSSTNCDQWVQCQ